MEKKLISLAEPQVVKINNEAEKFGLAFSEMVRRIIDKYFEDKK